MSGFLGNFFFLEIGLKKLQADLGKTDLEFERAFSKLYCSFHWVG